MLKLLKFFLILLVFVGSIVAQEYNENYDNYHIVTPALNNFSDNPRIRIIAFPSSNEIGPYGPTSLGMVLRYSDGLYELGVNTFGGFGFARDASNANRTPSDSQYILSDKKSSIEEAAYSLATTLSNFFEFPIRITYDSNPLDSATNWTIGAPLPVVFIPGILGSEISLSKTLERIWPPSVGLDFLEDLEALKLEKPRNDSFANSVLWKNGDSPIYQPLEDYHIENGFISFREIVASNRSQLTQNFLLNEDFEVVPDFFPFPYDWRQSIDSHVDALDEYIKGISKLHGDIKVNIIAHSMGGLIARRYLISKGHDKVEKLATIGTPFLGAPKTVRSLLEGRLFEDLGLPIVDLIANDVFLETSRTFPSVHQLLPPKAYNQSYFTVRSLGLQFKPSSFADNMLTPIETIQTIGKLTERNDILPNHKMFWKKSSQYDWSNDKLGVDSYHVVGSNIETIVRIRRILSRQIKTRYWITTERERYEYDTKNLGDGTVPLSSSIISNTFMSPNANFVVSDSESSNEHQQLASNLDVLTDISRFFSDVDIADETELALNQNRQAKNDSSRIITVEIEGEPYVEILNTATGDTNSRTFDYIVERVPDVQAEYSEISNRVTLTYPGGLPIEVRGDEVKGTDSVYLKIFIDEGEKRVAQYKYFIPPDEGAWMLNGDSYEVFVDKDGDTNFISDEKLDAVVKEAINPDLVPPTISVQLTETDFEIIYDLSALDDRDIEPDLFIMFGEQTAFEEYTKPLRFDKNSKTVLQAFAGDSSMNYSDVTVTALNPQIKISPSTPQQPSDVRLEWPRADGYQLMESPDLNTFLPSKRRIGLGVYTNYLDLSEEDANKLFFRLQIPSDE